MKRLCSAHAGRMLSSVLSFVSTSLRWPSLSPRSPVPSRLEQDIDSPDRDICDAADAVDCKSVPVRESLQSSAKASIEINELSSVFMDVLGELNRAVPQLKLPQVRAESREPELADSSDEAQDWSSIQRCTSSYGRWNCAKFPDCFCGRTPNDTRQMIH